MVRFLFTLCIMVFYCLCDTSYGMDFSEEGYCELHRQHGEHFEKILEIARIVIDSDSQLAPEAEAYEKNRSDIVQSFEQGTRLSEYITLLDQAVSQYLHGSKFDFPKNKANEKLLILTDLLDKGSVIQEEANIITECFSNMEAYAFDYPQVVELFIEYALTHQEYLSRFSILAKFISLYAGISLDEEIEKKKALSFLEFWNENNEAFSEYNSPIAFLVAAFPAMTENFSERQLALKALLFIKELVESFPLPRPQSEILKKILGMTEKKEELYDSKPFTGTYGSENIFGTFSARVVSLLSDDLLTPVLSLEVNEQKEYLRSVFQYLGLVRGVIDLFPGKKTSSELGQLVGYTLNEPWGQFHIIRRVFELMFLGGMSIEDAIKYCDREVSHFPPCNWDNFLSPLIDALKTDNVEIWYPKISNFIYRFALSSTFKRGQGAIMEWVYKAFAKRKNINFQLKYATNDTVENSFHFVMTTLNQDSFFAVQKIANYQSLREFFKQEIEKYSRKKIIGPPYNLLMSLKDLFSHLDVVALNVSSAINNKDLESVFFEIMKSIVDIN